MLNIILYDYYTIYYTYFQNGRRGERGGRGRGTTKEGRGRGKGTGKGWITGGGGGGGGLRKYCIKGVSWPKSGGLGKKYFKGGPGQKGVNQILRGGCDLG